MEAEFHNIFAREGVRTAKNGGNCLVEYVAGFVEDIAEVGGVGLAFFRERPFQTESAMGRAPVPDRRIMAKAPLPEGVANATIVVVVVIVVVVEE